MNKSNSNIMLRNMFLNINILIITCILLYFLANYNYAISNVNILKFNEQHHLIGRDINIFFIYCLFMLIIFISSILYLFNLINLFCLLKHKRIIVLSIHLAVIILTLIIGFNINNIITWIVRLV